MAAMSSDGGITPSKSRTCRTSVDNSPGSPGSACCMKVAIRSSPNHYPAGSAASAKLLEPLETAVGPPQIGWDVPGADIGQPVAGEVERAQQQGHEHAAVVAFRKRGVEQRHRLLRFAKQCGGVGPHRKPAYERVRS